MASRWVRSLGRTDPQVIDATVLPRVKRPLLAATLDEHDGDEVCEDECVVVVL